MARERVPEFVYFVRGGDGLIKIGRSINVAKRLEAIRAFNPRAELVALVAGGSRLESSLHRGYAPFHVGGEWFEAGPELQRMIRELGLPDEPPLTRRNIERALERRLRREVA